MYVCMYVCMYIYIYIHIYIYIYIKRGPEFLSPGIFAMRVTA